MALIKQMQKKSSQNPSSAVKTTEVDMSSQAAKKLKKASLVDSLYVGLGIKSAKPKDKKGSSENGFEVSSHIDIDLTDSSSQELLALPFLGKRKMGQHRRFLMLFLSISVVILVGLTAFELIRAERVAQQVTATGQALMQSQRLAKSVSQALLGDPEAFTEVKQSSDVLIKNFKGLKTGDTALKLQPVGLELQADMEKLVPILDRAAKNSVVLLSQQKILTSVSDALRTISLQSADLLDITETIAALKAYQNASATEMVAVGQLVMLTQRIGKSANELLTNNGVSAESVSILGRDINTFREFSSALKDGSSQLRLPPSEDPVLRERATALITLFEQTVAQSKTVVQNLYGLDAAYQANNSIITDSEPLRLGLETIQTKLSEKAGLSILVLSVLVGATLLALVCGVGLAFLQVLDSKNRQIVAENQRREAKSQEQDAKRVNDANQASILRLMNELQVVAEGDLTQEATVTEDITGAIADSVNYTVEELRQLVTNVQSAAGRVASTTEQVEKTSTELLATSSEQLREIRETGQSVLDMGLRINTISTQAQESSQVARQSLQAAESGLTAVQNAIGGMNLIRDQIQDTSKRIKRLGESSQEIGEITELISDITEQTNVLALNAAIQAASAGEAGRGFAVVAEEVQRLAERSADATKQIAILVKTIQADTQDAVAAMERSTLGVVEGAHLSDNAGHELSEIDVITRRLAELIEQISASTLKEAEFANELVGNIQHIFSVTEQTGDGTRSTSQQVRDLSRIAEELKNSVSRFKIA